MSQVVNNSRPPKRRRPNWGKIALALCLIALLGLGVFIGRLIKAVTPLAGEGTGKGPRSAMEGLRDLAQIVGDPRAGFPGADRVNILCMGIDDNWTNSDEIYTRGARTDTLFLLSLDLDNQKAYILSIPRDSFVHIAGTDYSDKINSAYSTGGPKRSEDTVAETFGVQPDYYIVLRTYTTATLVNALGGVDVNVEHEMNYDDNWGQLHVHLMPGFQHLNGLQAVGFARYRHGNHGLTPEDGDPRRIYRQHVLVRAMIKKAESPAIWMHANDLIDTAMSNVDTDLTRTQLADIAVLFHKMQPDDLVAAQLNGTDFKGPHGAWDTKLDDAKSKLYIDWLIRGDETAARALTPVVVKNGTQTSGLAQRAVDALRSAGYTDIRNGGNAGVQAARTDIVDTGVPYHDSGNNIAALLNIVGATVARRLVQPNRAGWTPPAAVTVVLGQDFASQAQTASANAPTAPAGTTP